MKVIKSDNFIEHGFTSEDFEKLRPEVEVALLSDGTPEVDFHGVAYYTTAFMAPFAALTYGRAIVTGMTATGSELYGVCCEAISGKQPTTERGL